eukprot:3559347-Amphidinium_carterae.1
MKANPDVADICYHCAFTFAAVTKALRAKGCQTRGSDPSMIHGHLIEGPLLAEFTLALAAILRYRYMMRSLHTFMTTVLRKCKASGKSAWRSDLQKPFESLARDMQNKARKA